MPRLIERFNLTGRVDRSGPHPVIRNVLLCGPTSANRRRYRKEAFAGGRVSVYRDRPVYLNHGDGRSGRTYQDRIGRVAEPRLNAAGMPVGDLIINPKHPYAEAVLWDAEHNPTACGMSHVANCNTVRGPDGVEEITQIASVESCDLVLDPATTRGFYESTKRAREMNETDTDTADGITSAFITAAHHLVQQAFDGDLDGKALAKKLRKLLDSHADVNETGDSDDDTDADDGAELPGLGDEYDPQQESRRRRRVPRDGRQFAEAVRGSGFTPARVLPSGPTLPTFRAEYRGGSGPATPTPTTAVTARVTERAPRTPFAALILE